MNGWGVFSTLRVADGVLFAWERHWARMVRDAQRLRVPMPETPVQLLSGLIDRVEIGVGREVANPDLHHRLRR